MMLEQRRKALFQKTAGVLTLLVGIDLVVTAFISQVALKTLTSLVNTWLGNLLPTYTLVVLAGIGGVAAIIAGVYLLKYGFKSVPLFWAGCALGVFLGFALSVSQASSLSDLLSILLHAYYWAPIALAVGAIWSASKI